MQVMHINSIGLQDHKQCKRQEEEEEKDKKTKADKKTNCQLKDQ